MISYPVFDEPEKSGRMTGGSEEDMSGTLRAGESRGILWFWLVEPKGQSTSG